MRHAIVTGAHGFLGRHITRDLRQRGVHVTTIGRLPTSDPSHVAMGDAPWSVRRVAQIIDSTEPEAVFHLAGGATGSPADLERLNVGLAATVMEALQTLGARPLLLCCGSAAEYGAAIIDEVPIAETTPCAPVSAYAASKLAQTNAALAFARDTGTPVLVARVFNPIGPGMPPYLALGDFARQIAAMRTNRGVVMTGNLNAFRDFLDVDHIAGMLWRLASNPDARGIVNICSGEATELRALLQALIAVSGKDVTIDTISARLRPGEVRTVVGSTELLAQLGAAAPRTNHTDAIARLWWDAEAEAARRTDAA